MGQLGQEYLTSNQHTAFPFDEAALGLVRAGRGLAHDYVATLPQDFLIDAVLYVPAVDGAQVYLSSIERAGPFEWRLAFDDQDGENIITVEYTTDVGAILGGTNDIATARLLKGDSFDAHLATITGLDKYQDRLPLASAAFELYPAHLASVEPYSTPLIPSPESPGPIGGNVGLRSGYNVSQRVYPGEAPDTTIIELSAAAGDGDGRVPCSEEEPIRRYKMPIRPDNRGLAYIEGDACYSVQPIPTDNGWGLQISGDCQACCSCDDYLAVAEALKQLILRANELRLELFAQLDEAYLPSIYDYHTRHFPEVRGNMTMEVVAIKGRPTPEDKPGGKSHGTVTIRVVNTTDARSETITLRVGIAPAAVCLGDTGSYTLGSGESAISGAAGYPQAILPAMDPGTAVAVVYRVSTRNPNTPPANCTVGLFYHHPVYPPPCDTDPNCPGPVQKTIHIEKAFT